MNAYKTNTLTLLQVTALTFMLSIVASCGGGGGDSSSTTPSSVPETPPTSGTDTNGSTTTTTESYQPDPEKQQNTAEETDDLYVEEDFEFNTYKVLTIDIQAVDDLGEALANTLLFVSSVPEQVSELDDQRMAEKSLMSVFKTDSSGAIYTQMEISTNVNKVLLELNTLGIENEVLISLSEDNMLQYQFN